MKKNKTILISALALMACGILLGAFGAHALKDVLAPEQLNSFETGVRYQLIHGLALMILLLLSFHLELDWSKPLKLMLAGILAFSGSIFLLIMFKHLDMPYKWLGPITPLGGSLLIVSWIWLMRSVYKNGK